MRATRYLLAAAVLAAIVAPARGQILFGQRKPPGQPAAPRLAPAEGPKIGAPSPGPLPLPLTEAERVRDLIASAQSGRSDAERAQAVADLCNFDAVAHPQIVSELVNVLMTDKSISVRIEAARSLGRLRPLTPRARDALASAALRDSAFRVRWQARASLAVYTVAGINPNNHAPTQPEQPQVIDREPKSPGGKAPPSVIVPPGKPNVTEGDGFARPLPKGPPQPSKPRPIPPSPQGGGTLEPPLTVPPAGAGDPLPQIPPPPPLNPSPPAGALPQVPPPSPAAPPAEGPVLEPPG